MGQNEAYSLNALTAQQRKASPMHTQNQLRNHDIDFDQREDVVKNNRRKHDEGRIVSGPDSCVSANEKEGFQSTDEKRYFVSEPSVHWAVKVHDLITSPAFVIMKAAGEFKDKTTAPKQLW
jgi:hypothetical protein